MESRPKVVSFTLTYAAVSEDCQLVKVIVTKVPSWRLCKSGVIFDRFDVWGYGTHALWIEGDDSRIERVSEFTARQIEMPRFDVRNSDFFYSITSQ